MTDTPVYVIVILIIQDAETHQKYKKTIPPLFKKYQFEFLTYDQPIHLEGKTPHSSCMIIFPFPSEQSAKDWFTHVDYQVFSEFHRAGTRIEFLKLVHGLPPRK